MTHSNLLPKPLHALLTLVFVASLVPTWAVAAQDTGPTVPVQQEYFDTGYTVRDPFYTYFIEHGGVERFGYPISNDYPDSRTGLLVQYFQKARLEYHPENLPPYDIQLGLLAEELAIATGKKPGPLPVEEIPAAADPTCHYFIEVRQKVCNSFLTYYRAQGGLDMFGYPVSGYLYENETIVQYFQRARFEWHPEKTAGQRVQTAFIGQIYVDYFEIEFGPSIDNTGSARPVISLVARSSVMSAITRRNGTQTAYVTVTDQFGNPVSGASVVLVVNSASGPMTYTLPATNAAGTTLQTFAVGSDVKPGQIVPLVFYITYIGGLTTTSRTSYLVWYY